MKNKLLTLLIFGIGLLTTIPAFAAILGGFQGGTGFGTTGAGNMGNFLSVASTSPFLTYTFATTTGGSGTLTGNGTSTQVAYYNGLQSLTSSANLTFDGTNLTNLGTTTVGTLKLSGLSANPQIYAGAQAGTGIHFPGPGVIDIDTAGVTRLNIDSLGDVSIGTSTTGDDTLGIKSNTAGPILEAYTSSTNTSVFIVSNLGNVGIGTTTPQTALHVIGDYTGASSTLSGQVNVGTFVKLSSSTQPNVANQDLVLHNFPNNGIPRLENDSIYTVNGCDVVNRDNCVIIKNNQGSNITIGQVVYVNGNVGANPQVKLAQANATSTAMALGLVASTTVANNGFTYVMTKGILSNVNTSAWTSGDPLYVSSTTAGALTNVRPTYPNLVTRVGTVLVSNASTGQILVEVAPAVLGQETGTINSTFNIGGSNAVTTTSIPSYAIVGLVGGTGIGVSSTTGVGTITNNGVTSFNGATGTVTGVSSLTSSSSIALTNSTGTVNVAAKDLLAQAVFSYTTSTSNWDDAFWIPKTTSTITQITGVNQVGVDAVTFNVCYGPSRNTASSTSFCAFSSYQTLTSTSTPTIFTINASSTPGLGQPVRILSYNASSTETTWSVYYTPQ